MAKKAVRKLEEDDEYRNFEFPAFDEGKFLSHEFEQTYATLLAFAFAMLIGLASFAVSRTVLGALAGFGVGVVLIVATPYVIQRLRANSSEYTRGEWAALLLLEIFGWLGSWFLVTDLLH